jgi:hypothetical protein
VDGVLCAVPGHVPDASVTLPQDQAYLKNTLAAFAGGKLAPLVGAEQLQVLRALATADA